MSLLAEAIASSGGATSAKFHAIGDTCSGKIINVDMRQARDFDTNEPKTWDDGNPVMNAVVTVEAGIIDPTIQDDDGSRSIYIKWYGQQKQALLAAVKAANDDDVRPGGTFTATYTGDAEPTRKGMAGAKLFAYQYTPPASALGQAMQQAAPAAQPAPAATPPLHAVAAPAAAAAAAPAPTAAPVADPQAALGQIKALIAAGLTDQQIAAAVPSFTSDAIAAVRAIPAA